MNNPTEIEALLKIALREGETITFNRSMPKFFGHPVIQVDYSTEWRDPEIHKAIDAAYRAGVLTEEEADAKRAKFVVRCGMAELIEINDPESAHRTLLHRVQRLQTMARSALEDLKRYPNYEGNEGQDDD